MKQQFKTDPEATFLLKYSARKRDTLTRQWKNSFPYSFVRVLFLAKVFFSRKTLVVRYISPRTPPFSLSAPLTPTLLSNEGGDRLALPSSSLPFLQDFRMNCGPFHPLPPFHPPSCRKSEIESRGIVCPAGKQLKVAARLTEHDFPLSISFPGRRCPFFAPGLQRVQQ